MRTFLKLDFRKGKKCRCFAMHLLGPKIVQSPVKLIVWLLSLCCSFSSYAREKYPLVICALFQNESFFLKEWIEFHKLVGVEHFYLYNNLSTDNYLEILTPYIQSGIVDLFDWPVTVNNQYEYLTELQLPIYNHALEIVRQSADWAAFIDLDEFLCPMRHLTLTQMLDAYRDYAGLSVNWQTFGTSRIENLRSEQLIIENLLWKAPSDWEFNKYTKMLVQPRYVHSFTQSPHYCVFYQGHFAVNSDKMPLDSFFGMQPILIDTIRIHHYWFGDRSWFLSNKMARREKWGTLPKNSDYLDSFINSFNQECDEAMLRFVSSLRANMLLPK